MIDCHDWLRHGLDWLIGSALPPLRTAVAVLSNEADDEMRLYEDLGNFEAIKPIFEALLELYNAKHKRMNLVRALARAARRWPCCAARR